MATHQNVDVANFTAATAIDNNFLMLAMNGMFAAGVAYSAYNVIDAYEKGGENGFNDAIKQLGIEVVPYAIGAASGYVIGKAIGAVYPTAQAAAKAVIDANPSLKLALGKFADKLTVIGQAVGGSTVGKAVTQAGSKIAKKAAKIKNEVALKIGFETAGAGFSKCTLPKDLVSGTQTVGKKIAGIQKTFPPSSHNHQIQLDRKLNALQIGSGHSFERHVIGQKEFVGIAKTQQEFLEHLEQVLADPQTLYREAVCPQHKIQGAPNLKFGCAKKIYYQESSNTLIINNQHRPDGGTAYQPVNKVQEFHEVS